MPDRDVTPQPAQDLFVEDAGNETHLAVTVERATVADRDSRAFLASVLQRVQRKVDEPGDVFAGRVHGGDPARFVEDVASRLDGFLVVPPRHLR